MKKKSSFSYAKYGYLFSIPFVVVYLIFSLYPIINTAILSFTDAKGLGNMTWHFLEGDIFKNYRTILGNATFRTSLKNTVFIWIINFIPQLSLALLLTAWFTSKRNELRGKGFFKVVFYMPNIITAASIAVLYKALFAYPVGPINDLLQSLGLIKEAFYFSNKALPSQLIIAFIQFWMWYGYTMIILTSAVLGISPELFEAAELDGASGTQIFFKITLPNIKTILLYTVITSMIGGLNMYDIPKLYNNGLPNNATLTTSVFIQNQAFQGSYLWARASAASMIMFVLIAICSLGVFAIFRDKDEAAAAKAKRRLKKAQKEAS
ncbi:MAG: sugar ABC transporter permease [Eubacteriales bacterium]|nr:sugar ABC transporter permease [Eubacteriales bacterium]